MNTEWLVAAPPFLASAALFVIPGLIVRLAGWNSRAITPYFLAPAISVALVAIASNAAPFVRLPWSLVPVAVVTAIVAVIAFVIRRWVGPEGTDNLGWKVLASSGAAIVLTGVAVSIQLMYVFASPGNVSQTFDNIVHLNSIRLALDTANSSAIEIGRTSDIGFYPNAWQSFVTLTAQMSGSTIPVAVNATNIAMGAIVWPWSCLALATAFFRARPAVILSAGALSSAFGAFPILLFGFGVLYPNAMGYALIPAGLAAVWMLVQADGARTRVRAALVLLLVAGGIGLAHPNAFLALYALAAFTVIIELFIRGLTRRDGTAWFTFLSVTVPILIIGAGLWKFARTGAEMSQWGPWTGTRQALVEGLLLSPRSFPVTIVTAALIVIGLVAAILRPRKLVFVAPFAVALFLFVVVSGMGYSFFRDMVTNPWYNDSFRLAALLPAAGIPVATLGCLAVVEGGVVLGRRWKFPRGLRIGVATATALLLFVTVATGPNVLAVASWARGSYELNEGSPLLTSAEMKLLSRLDQTTPRNALILGNPWTGTSLAFAVANRQVVERHIFGMRTPDELYLEKHLRDIGRDPRVCEAIDGTKATYVLDFGSQNVFNNPAAGTDHSGMNDLPSSPHLQLVDSEGSAARLFKVQGC